MRILVCGGRDFDTSEDRRRVFATLERLDGERRIECVIEGGANGADACARQWAELSGRSLETWPAQWASFGRAAGPIRNEFMLTRMPDLVLAFPGGRGTADMVRRAREVGIAVMEVE